MIITSISLNSMFSCTEHAELRGPAEGSVKSSRKRRRRRKETGPFFIELTLNDRNAVDQSGVLEWCHQSALHMHENFRKFPDFKKFVGKYNRKKVYLRLVSTQKC